MKSLIIFFAIAGPVLGIIYSSLDYYGVIDSWNKQKYAQEALKRLQSPAGYPKSWIYNDSIDEKHFEAIFKIIKRRTNNIGALNNLKQGFQPSLITIAGQPIKIQGVPDEYPQERKSTYTDDYTILLAFNVYRDGKSNNEYGDNGKANSVCTLGELKEWVDRESQKYDYRIGVLVVGFLSIAITLQQLKFSQH